MKNIPLVECWNFVGSTPQKFDGEKRYISTGALDKDHINEADVEMVTFDNRPSRANLEENSGDILFAKMASTEKTFVVDSISQNDIYSTGFCAVRANESKILSKCLYYFLSSSLFLEQKDKNSSGATQKAITNAGLSKIYINLPELAKQQEFIEQMDSLTSLITARREQLAKLDELVKSRFIELFGDPDTNPLGWNEDVLSEHLEVIGGYAFKSDKFEDEGIPVLRIGNINSGRFLPVNMVYWNDDPTLERYKMYPGDLVMSLTGTVGKDDYGNVCILGADYPEYYLNQRNAKLSLKPTLNAKYLSELLKFERIKRRLTGISRGVRQANISNKDILCLCVPIAPINLQQQFAAFVEQTDKSKFEIQKSLEKLETLKKALMQKYFG
jgi:type I restriction enzyme S subunit